MKKYNWGVLGTGLIAHEMGEALKAVNGEIYAVCGTSLEKAENISTNLELQQHMAARKRCLQMKK